MQSETSFDQDMQALNDAIEDCQKRLKKYTKRNMWFIAISTGTIAYLILYALSKF